MTREELNQDKQQKIFSEQRDEKRKKITIFFFKLAFSIIFCFIAFYLYTTFISTKLLTVNEYRVINDKLPDNFNGLKIVHFTDLHYGTTIFIDDIKSLVKEINERTPDIVIFTGDLIDSSYDLNTNEQEMVSKELSKINAVLGKYAISGEEDNDLFLTIMKQSNFEIINNSYELIYKDHNIPIMLVGIDSSVKNRSNIAEAFSYYSEPSHNSNLFSIAMFHEPDNIDSILTQYDSDIYLAGHSHNGTIRLPFIGGIYEYEGAKKYIDSYYKIGEGNLYISSGVGTNGPGFRLFCRPSINFFRISNK